MNRSPASIAAQVSVLVCVAGVLIATSPMPECIESGPVTYFVQTNCGPSGELVVENNSSCDLTVTGASALNLPSGYAEMHGSKRTFKESSFTLFTASYEVYASGNRDDAGLVVADGDGGTGGRFTFCSFTRSSEAALDAGTTFGIACVSDEAESAERVVCSGTATER